MTRKRYKLSEATKRRQSQAQKRRFAKERAWNVGVLWPVDVKENISSGMIQYWQEHKHERIDELRLNGVRLNEGFKEWRRRLLLQHQEQQ